MTLKNLKYFITLGLLALFTLFIAGCDSKAEDIVPSEPETPVVKEDVDDYVFSIGSPSGAPGIAIAQYATVYNNTSYVKFGLTADTLKAAFMKQEYDVIVAPVNLGAVMYKNTGKYKLASVLTWGNLYFASAKENFNINDLNGADVVMFGQSTVNDVIIQNVLKKKNITLGANTRYLDSTNDTKAMLDENPNGIYLVAEPALSASKKANANIKSISVQELYKEVTGKNSYPQAGLFINVNVLDKHEKAVKDFLTKIEASAKATSTDLDTVAGYAEALSLGGKKPILLTAIPNSNINYVKASDAKADIEAVAALNLKLFGGALPASEFYYA